ncbi:patronin-like isoform X9 [Pectinophora gossypiella]|uniref:patronin-like isoform X9 n=1 Tax=Pectinophora gossypiella TaxID=13191 RepID=UPI00214F4EF3|nr:patronin-like isoform X9 [Pectinophora gossypiella]
MVAMVASASGYGTLRRFLSAPDGHGVEQAGGVPSASVAVSSKQRASIKWLLSKAFNNRVPENLQEPFYRDHEDQEHLKPPIVGGLANAELYCLALANMYSDPNYHSLNHWNILQTLARKGVHVPDPPDCALTETVLIQTNPLKMGAHMSVMEALMILYAREVVTLDRVSAAAQRFGTGAPVVGGSSVPHEDGLLGWINAACTALNKAEEDTSLHVPMVKSLQELCDGTALAALISFYCPDALPRSSVRVGRMASIQDCLHNLMLVHDFCQNCLPHNVFHMMPEDVTYMRGSMRQNLIAMLADLFNMLEVHPVKSVKHPGSGIQSMFNQSESDRPDRRKTSFSTPPANTTTWQQQFMQHENQPNGDDMSDDAGNSPGGGQAMAAQLNNIRLKLEEKRRRIEQEKRRMELAVNRQRQQLGQQAFLQAVTRGKGARTPADDDLKTDSPHQDMAEAQAQNVDVVALEQYQQSIAKMNSSLQDIQTDIARLASQQNQLQQQQQNQLQQQQNQLQQQQQQNQLQQQQQQQNQLQQQAKQLFQNQFQPQQPQQPYQHQQQQPYQPNIPQLHSQFSSQHNVSRPALASGFGSTPHIPQQHFYQQQQQNFQQQNYQQQQSYQPQQPQQMYEQQYQAQYRDMDEYNRQQFYLHDSPPPPQRRTWAQHAQQQQQHQQQQQTQENTELRGWQLHQQNHQQYQPQEPPRPEAAARTWKSPSPQPPADRWAPQGFVLHDRDRDRPEQPFQVHYNNDRYQNGTDNNHMSYTVINNQYSQSPPLAVSPRRSKTPQRQGSLPEASRRAEPVSLQQLHAPPPPADMEPQNISFIGNAEDDALRQGINRLNISSGTRTYRIPSPTRPSLSRNSFQQIEQEEANDANEKGFYISFDNEQPKRPKPPLRTKRGSPKKDRTPVDYQSPARSPENTWSERLPQPADEPFVVHRAAAALDHARSNDVSSERRETPPRERTLRPGAEPAAIIIGDVNIDPNSAEEMERKKERIMLLSLQRRQRADEARARAEHKLARKEEQARRREQILYQYKLKKAMEEAEREPLDKRKSLHSWQIEKNKRKSYSGGKVLDKSEFMESMKGGGGAAPAVAGAGARLRGKAAAARARPKTIHVDSGALHAAEGMLATKQPSSTNLTGGMRRDYYRGSQDSLAERAGLYRESPVEDRGGMSPGSASSGPLGRRGSCKTSRERVSEEPQSTRGRSKYSTYQSNFKTGRKSSSLMNLCDSGLGRATPPRRAASPGLRALGSPAGSGPGSLPGAIGKRRVHAPDDASDVSSTHSSIMDYSGPRLYKQPTTKSNRGIMLNAVEYCVFPGAVNAEAKRRVLEEIARSEAKHFLVLFRDAGCQFRALYSYCPDTEQVTKLYGTGPKHVNDRMFDKFFKYNSGSKCFSQVHTKHLTVTIDAFTIHNSLWQGKKTQLPSKKDMALVI